MPQQQRKMVGIDVVETSGVDHPAHLTEGWVVMKSAKPADVEDLFGSLNTMKGTNVPETQNGAKETQKGAEAPTVEDLQKQLEQVTKERDEAIAKAEAPAPVEKAADTEEMLKSLPEPVRQMLAKAAQQEADLAEAREAIAKERDARLDAEVIAESKATYKAVAINHGEVAPALRRVAAISPELAKSVETALKAADAQLSEAGLFREIGSVNKSAAEGGTAIAQINAKAEEIRKSESNLTAEQAFAKAVAAEPELYTQYFIESQEAGK